MKTKINLSKIRAQAKRINGIVSEGRKKLFELEIMQSVWESDHGLGKKYDSVEKLMEDIHKKTTVYL